ncbi:hypothetical protein [uncultured Paracoccus sp.]|uniref:hypothetical protein n=1 Tax=uncultured Paracoccus sp. TaxID=189685 RepID=UPI00260C3370|nr:hypothetical protein [uncultured Paracoccus sp.]
MRYWLEAAAIDFEGEWRHETCRNVKPLPFDFYVGDLNLLIEVDGIHHFEPVLWRGSGTPEEAEIRLKEVQRRDRIKNLRAKEQGFALLRLRYDTDMETLLEQRLVQLGWTPPAAPIPRLADADGEVGGKVGIDARS